MTAPSLGSSDHVLVVDDEQFSRQIVARFLRELGNPEVHAARDGSEALAILATVPIRIVISDFNMPGRNGLDLLKAIRTSPGIIRHDLPVVMLTGLSDRALVGAAVALDVDSFVVKPVSKATLASRIERALADGREIKRPDEYHQVDVAAATAHLLKHDPVGLPSKAGQRRDQAACRPSNCRRVALAAIQPGAVLAEEIRAPTGELLLADGAILTARLINRLRDLAGMKLNVGHVWVRG
jgi:CheY-like chemotaxis protein